MKYYFVIFTILILLLSNYDIFAQPVDENRRVVIESIFVNGTLQKDFTGKILANDKDSILINFKLKAPDDAAKSPFLFQTVFKNGVDSSIKTMGVTTAIFKNLKDDKYTLKIAAFDLQRKWSAVPVIVEIEIDNEKSALVRTNDSLNQKINSITSSNKAPISVLKGHSDNSGSLNLYHYILVVLLLVALIIIVFISIKITKLKQSKQVPAGKSSNFDYSMIKNMVNKSDYELLQLENGRLRAEISSLRGQIDAMNARSQQLSNQNTELQKSLTKLSTHKVELEELQQQKDDLFAVIIHDIKNPASLIKSLVELLTSYDLSALEQQEIITDIANTTTKIVALSQEVSRILSLESNKLSLKFEMCDINQVVHDVFHRNHIGGKNKSINMIEELDDALPDVEIDPQRIDEVIDNLLSNAIKFTQTGGTVQIKTFKQLNEVIVEISDNGLGLSENDLKHAFQRGARLSAKPTQGESSTGLGLWIVKKLLDTHHGKIWVKSTIGKGSTFTFSLPIKQPTDSE